MAIGPHQALNERTQRLILQATQLDACGLWMLSREADLPPDESMHIVAACFDNLALALDVAVALDAKDWEDRDTLLTVFEILAESQSALRRALIECGLPPDEEQTHAFYWLRRQTEQHSVYLERYMRLDNPADPADWEARSRRLHELEQRLTEARSQRRTQLEFRKRLAYHAKRIRNAAPGAEFVLNDWKKVDDTAAALLGLGVRPSERELRDELLPILELRPNQIELPEAVRPIYNEIDRYLASKEFDSPPPPPARERSPAVQKVADLLRGKRIVLIGGVERPHSKFALERAFELQELEWITTREHESTVYLEAPHLPRRHLPRPGPHPLGLALPLQGLDDLGEATQQAPGPPHPRLQPQPSGRGNPAAAVRGVSTAPPASTAQAVAQFANDLRTRTRGRQLRTCRRQ